VRIHLDEDADSYALLTALRHRGLDLTSSREEGLLHFTDEEQLEWATKEGRSTYTYNVSDFCRLHSARMRQGRNHAGIIIGDQQAVSIGEEMRRLLKLSEIKSAEDMADHLEFLNNWK
jgi:hypothetical protein